MVNTRKWDVVSVRMMVAAVLLAESWTLEDVGKYFGKNHSTICHYVKRLKRIDGAGWEAEWDLYQRFLKEISK